MPEFLKKASCRGRRPLHLASRRQIPRPDLIAKLLRERHVARFIVAPDGFGKTGLAMEYADTVFSFEHVVWLDGRSPCFLRDLDRGVIARTLLDDDAQPFLVVIDDVPPLDPERAELLSDELDLLLDRDCEVMVTCMPSRTMRGMAAKPSRVTGSLMKRLPPISPRRARASATMSSARWQTIWTCS